VLLGLWRGDSELLAELGGLEGPCVLEIGDVLLKHSQVLDQSSVELLSLMEHVFKILLAHKR